MKSLIVPSFFYFLSLCPLTWSLWGSACDFSAFSTGCDEAMGLTCNQKVCLCRADHPVKVGSGVCLKTQKIHEKCYFSAQCNHIPNAGCLLTGGYEYEIEDTFWWYSVGPLIPTYSRRFGRKSYDYDSAPGKCKCKAGFYFEVFNQTCVQKVVGSRCKVDADCGRIEDSICWISTCECRPGFVYDTKTDTCLLPKAYSERCNSLEKCYKLLIIPQKLPDIVHEQWKHIMIVCEILFFVIMIIMALIYCREKGVFSFTRSQELVIVSSPTDVSISNGFTDDSMSDVRIPRSSVCSEPSLNLSLDEERPPSYSEIVAYKVEQTLPPPPPPPPYEEAVA